MSFKFLLVLGISCLSVQGVAQQAFPPDVAKFIERRDACDHFRGEYPYDEERGHFIKKNLKEFCTGTDRQLSKLKKEHAKQPHITEKLETYEVKIELNAHD